MRPCLAAVAVLAGFAVQSVRADTVSGAAAPDVSYGPYPIQTLQVCQPDDGNAGPRAATLLIHGGAWVSEGRRIPWFQSLCRNLAARGVVVFNIDYRLLRVGTGENAWPAQLQDVQLAMRWARANTRQYNIDPKRICAFGTSAGGNLAVLLGIEGEIVPPLKDEDPRHQTALYPDRSPRADCVVDVSGPTDLTKMPPNSDKVLAAMAAPLAAGGGPPQGLAGISPINRIGPGSGPVLILYGTIDRGVPPATQAQPFYQALKDKGVPVTLLEYTGHHALGMTAQSEVDRALDAAAEFIKKPN